MEDLVLLHAFPLDARMWDVPDAITPDLRGGDREPDLAALAEDVLAELDARGLDQVVLGGCSMGGYVAMAFLRLAPERVKGLVFVDTKHTADAPEAAANRLAMAERVEREGVGEWLVDALLPVLGPEASDDVKSRVRAMILAQQPADVAWWQRAMARRPDSTDVLEAIDVPALVLVGEHDQLTPPDVVAKLAVTMRHATSERIEEAGHLPPVEQPEEFRARLERWRAQVHL